MSAFIKPVDWAAHCVNYARMLLSGPIAETLLLGGFRAGGNPDRAWRAGFALADTATWAGDWRALQRLKTRHLPHMCEWRVFSMALVDIARDWPVVQRVADVLTDRRVLSRAEIIQIVFSRKEQAA
jgi:hypothetical protein